MPLSRLAFGPAPRSGRKVFVAERRAQGEIVTFRLVSTRTNMAVSALMPTAKVPITSAVKPDFWGAGDETRMSLGISASAIYGSRRCSRAQYFSDEWLAMDAGGSRGRIGGQCVQCRIGCSPLTAPRLPEIEDVRTHMPPGLQTRAALHLIISADLSHSRRNGVLVVRLVLGGNRHTRLEA